MKGIILAAGFGRRLRPLTDQIPKPLLPVGGRCVIHHTLLLLKKYGITEVFINLHYHADKIKIALGNGSSFGMKITYSEEPEILGTGGGIKKIYSHLGREDALVINGDILIEVNLDHLMAFHQERAGAATLVLRAQDSEEFGVIEIDSSDQIRNILGQVPSQGGRLRHCMFTGAQMISQTVVDAIPEGVFSSITDTYIEMLRRGERLFGYTMQGYWNDIGLLARYQEADRDVKGGRFSI